MNSGITVTGLLCYVLGIVSLTGCATTGAPPLTLAPGQPVRLSLPNDSVNLQVLTTPIGGGTSVVTMLLSEQIDDANRANTARLREEAKRHQETEPLQRLFESELRKRIEARGVKLEADAAALGSITISLENLTAMYYATTFATSYEPTAFVYVTSSTDPPTVGNRPGAVVRSIAVKVSRPDYSFSSSSSIFSEPTKAYAGLRMAVVELADRVAMAIAQAQGPGMVGAHSHANRHRARPLN